MKNISQEHPYCFFFAVMSSFFSYLKIGSTHRITCSQSVTPSPAARPVLLLPRRCHERRCDPRRLVVAVATDGAPRQVVALFRRSIEANGFSELVAPASDAEVSTDERASEGSGVGMGSGETPDGLVSKAGGFSKAGGCSKAGFLHFPSTFPTSKYKKRRCIVIRLLDSQITPDRSFNELKAIGALPPTGPKRDRKTHS